LLGEVYDVEPTKRELRRYLIEELLKQHPFDTNLWVSDYCNFVVSVGKLYSGYDDDRNTEYSVPHTRTPPGGGTESLIVNSRVVFKGFVEHKELQKLVTAKKAKVNASDQPLLDLMALNIVSWKDINVVGDRFEGGRVVNKFFPDGPNLRKEIGANKRWDDKLRKKVPTGDPLYIAKMGFFSSMRPGDKSTLLNINVATSPFFPVTSLQEWIKVRWSPNTNIPTGVGESKLKGMKVRCTMDPGYPNSKVYRICDFEAKVVSGVGISRNGKEIAVLQDLKARELILNPVADLRTDHSLLLGYVVPLNDRTIFDGRACCVNVGTEHDPSYLPGDKLVFVDWQLPREKLDRESTQDMIAFAKQSPRENKQKIMNHALVPLGIKTDTSVDSKNPEFLKVKGLRY
jgi:hypothetical protein